jgi:glutathione S-transferase
MSLQLYAHPFSSYCQKVLTALYENGTPFEYRQLSNDDPQPMAELAARWPLKRFPVLVDDDRTIAESTIIIEHLALHYPGPVQLLRPIRVPRSTSASWTASSIITFPRRSKKLCSTACCPKAIATRTV